MVDDSLRRSQQSDDTVSEFAAAMADMPEMPEAPETLEMSEMPEMPEMPSAMTATGAIMETPETAGFDAAQAGDKTHETLPVHGRVKRVIEEVRAMEPNKERGGAAAWPEREIRCDRDHIDGQRIVVTNAENIHQTICRLKIAEEKYYPILEHLNQTQETLAGNPVERANITYHNNGYGQTRRRHIRAEEESGDCKLCDAWMFTRSNEQGQSMRVYIADAFYHDGEKARKEIRSAVGMVRMETSDDMSPEEMERMLEEITSEDLGIPHALEEVTAEAESDYKIAKYAWQQGTTPLGLRPEERAEAMSMHLEEVADGYQTYVVDGRGERLRQQYGDFVLTHHLHRDNRLSYRQDVRRMANALKRAFGDGLSSTEERYGRGVINNGQSSSSDLVEGGAASVFARVIMKDMLPLIDPGVVLLMKPKLMDRVDCYCYSDDNFGSTRAEDLEKRYSPEGMMEIVSLKNPHNQGIDASMTAQDLEGSYPLFNEIMFQTGIGPQYIQNVMVPDAQYREDLITALHRLGVREFNGLSLEDLIVSREEMSYEAELASSVGYPDQDDFFDEDNYDDSYGGGYDDYADGSYYGYGTSRRNWSDL